MYHQYTGYDSFDGSIVVCLEGEVYLLYNTNRQPDRMKPFYHIRRNLAEKYTYRKVNPGTKVELIQE